MNTAKRWLCTVLAGVLALGLSSCGKEEFYFQNVTASDYVTLGQYTGLTVSSEELDEYWASTADSILQANSTQEEVDRAAAVGDTVTYSATAVRKDTGAEEESLAVTDKTLTIAENPTSEQVVGLNQALLGHAKDETFTADLTLSDSYSTSETSLNGLAVTYTITVSKVEQTVVPETLTDEMVKNYTEMMASYYGSSDTYETVDEYQKAVRQSRMLSEIWTQVTKNTTVEGYPRDEALQLYHNTLESYNAYAIENNTTLEAYLPTAMGADSFDDALVEIRDSSIDQAQRILIYLAIFDAEKLDYQAKYDEIKADESSDGYSKDYVILSAKISTVDEFLLDHNSESASEASASGETQSEDANGDTQSTQQTQATQGTSATEQTTAPDAVQSQAVQGSETVDDAEQSEINSMAAVSADA